MNLTGIQAAREQIQIQFGSEPLDGGRRNGKYLFTLVK